jgi:iron complex transport system ATP-binding protein
MLEISSLTVSYGKKKVIDDLSFSVSEGQWFMIAGPNGAGKSTVLNAVSQAVPYLGSIRFKGREIKTMKAGERARHIGVLLQNNQIGYAFSVEDVVRLGRYAYRSWAFSKEKSDDESAIADALEATGMTYLRNKSVFTLSGGELQRCFLAQVFAQQPELLLLDEPTNHLDLVFQKQIFGLISEWLRVPGRAVISVVHDLSLARAYGTHALLIKDGRRTAIGTAEEVFTASNLENVYSMDVNGWMQSLLKQWE